MRLLVDHRFCIEVARFSLRFTCRDCLHRLADDTCAHEWPNADHREVPVIAADDPPREVVFCKEFELG